MESHECGEKIPMVPPFAITVTGLEARTPTIVKT